MRAKFIPRRGLAECQELGAFLVDRIDEFNARATGYFDGMLLAGYERKYAIEGSPKGHADIIYVKVLQHENRA